jgi:hypothetical protein
MACSNPTAVLISALNAQLERSPDALGTRNLSVSYTSAVACALQGAVGPTGATGATGATGVCPPPIG